MRISKEEIRLSLRRHWDRCFIQLYKKPAELMGGKQLQGWVQILQQKSLHRQRNKRFMVEANWKARGCSSPDRLDDYPKKRA
ncbi:MAG TPA: hypothetical protein EYO33_15200 [Phycisphaerales bacterium]|nr:hypothetical protein [Phycisphaerales bacterium]